MSKLRRPSPALVVAVVALFMSISGTAYATGVVPVAKRALLAKNALKLQGKSAKQVAGIPGPATDLEGLLADDIAAMPEGLLGPMSGKLQGALGRLRDSQQRPRSGHATDCERRGLDALPDEHVRLGQRDRERAGRLPVLSGQ